MSEFSNYLRAAALATHGAYCAFCGSGPLHRRAAHIVPDDLTNPVLDAARALVLCSSCNADYAAETNLPAYLARRRAVLSAALGRVARLEERYTARITPKVEVTPKPAPAAPKPVVDRNAIVEDPDAVDPGWDWQNEAGIVASAPLEVEYSETRISAPAPLPTVKLDDAWGE